jgi:hypothetical protein
VTYVWNEDKNTLLKQARNISFEQVLLSIEEGNTVDVIDHPDQKKHGGQFFILVEINRYIYVVPALVSPSGGECFLKTVYPSRKYTQKYLGS